MKNVQRSEIVDYQTYEETREAFRTMVLAEKARRRVHVGEYITFLFENATTIRYQVQEMMRTERIVKEKDILHELETYNGLLGGDGELGATLLIEIDDPEERAVKLREWFSLPEHVYALTEDGAKVRITFDPGQRGVDRLSSVQYVKFPMRGAVPSAVGVDHPAIKAETRLSADQRLALSEDLSDPH
jgi:hypothetical protein